MPAKTCRKILKSGTSKVIALPPDWLKAFNLKTGDDVEVLYNFIVLVKPKNVEVDFKFLKKELEILEQLENKRND